MSAPVGAELRERAIRRVRALFAHAVHTGSDAQEADTAKTMLLQYLDTHRPPVRFCYPSGTLVRVLPVSAANTPKAKVLIRQTRAHRSGSFRELQRVVDVNVSVPALRRGYVPFERFGYYVFVPLTSLEIRI